MAASSVVHHDTDKAFGCDLPSPSQRPPFNVGVVASLAGFTDTRGNVPLHLCVLERTPLTPAPATTDKRDLLVLVYVDGVASMKEIADASGLSLAEVIESFLRLLKDGLVEVVGEEPPRSGVVSRVVV